MRLAWLALRGYRRFLKCDLQLLGRVIALVGPNEAGKSSVLDALVSLNDSKPIPGSDITHGEPFGDSDVVIRARFLLDDEDREAISSVQGATGARWFIVSKRRDGGLATTVEPGIALPNDSRLVAVRAVARLATTSWARVAHLQDERPAVEVLEEIGTTLSKDGVLDDADRTLLRATAAALAEPELAPSKGAIALADRLGRLATDEPSEHPHDAVRRTLFERRPTFAKFGDDDRSLQSEYDLVEMDADDPPASLYNLATLAGLDLPGLKSAVASGELARAERPIRDANAELEEFFQRSWTQSGIAVTFSLHGTRLHVFVSVPDGDFTSIRERSDGLRAFVALTTFIALQADADRFVLLIDEAETHLHYDAQADLVRVFGLQRAADSIIYTTHSAGCLPDDLGSAVRVVRRIDDKLSDVSNAFWTAGQGFSPLLLGMGASALAFSAVRRAVIAEGAADLILLPSLLKEATGRSVLGYQIAPGVAEVSKASVADLSLEAGRAVFVTDDDQGGRLNARKLRKAGIDSWRILTLGHGIEAGLAPEDLVRKDLYLKAINEELQRSGREQRMTARDLGDKGRSKSVQRWARAREYSEPKKVNVAQTLALSLEEAKPVLTRRGRRVMQDLDRRIDDALSR